MLKASSCICRYFKLIICSHFRERENSHLHSILHSSTHSQSRTLILLVHDISSRKDQRGLCFIRMALDGASPSRQPQATVRAHHPKHIE